jgi:RNA polymerase sigma-70 factor, ECF subfamily
MPVSASLQSLTPLTDEEVVQRIRDGDSAVFELLMRRHNQRLFRLARSIIRDDTEAEDIVQETYLRAYTNLHRFEGRSSVATWLSRIAFHESLSRLRRRRQAKVATSARIDAMQASQGGEASIDSIAQTELRMSLAAALDSLPASFRAIVMLRLVEGLSTQETADSLRLTPTNVRVGLFRARRQLQETIQKQALPRFREAFVFGEQRCDRVVSRVFAALAERHL